MEKDEMRRAVHNQWGGVIYEQGVSVAALKAERRSPRNKPVILQDGRLLSGNAGKERIGALGDNRENERCLRSSSLVELGCVSLRSPRREVTFLLDAAR